MAMKIKIAFFDVDGTLIDMERKKITPNTVAALVGQSGGYHPGEQRQGRRHPGGAGILPPDQGGSHCLWRRGQRSGNALLRGHRHCNGNASEALKAIATEVCGDVKDDGIAAYCLEKGLIDRL